RRFPAAEVFTIFGDINCKFTIFTGRVCRFAELKMSFAGSSHFMAQRGILQSFLAFAFDGRGVLIFYTFSCRGVQRSDAFQVTSKSLYSIESLLGAVGDGEMHECKMGMKMGIGVRVTE
ncbi:hypothetical protein KI387_031455, partial [Taxus chinensis]